MPRILSILPLCVIAVLLGCDAQPPAEPATPEAEGGAVHTETIAYEHGNVELEGYLARPTDGSGALPGVLVVHEWWGLNDFARAKARELARAGLVALACDMYGKGMVTNDPAQAQQWSGALYGTPMLAARAKAGLDVLKQQDGVDVDRLAAIGFCFGGTTALELAYTGADLAGVVSFHGQPTPPDPHDVPGIQARILVLHGADDPLVKQETIDAFRRALPDARWIAYEGAVHSFTNPNADSHGIEGVAYDAEAARRSWRDMLAFFDEVLGPTGPDESESAR